MSLRLLLSGALLVAGGLGACGRTEPTPAGAPPMSGPASPPELELWARTDRVEGPEADGSVLPGAREALARCQGPSPCVLERFRSEGTGATLLLLRDGERLSRLSPEQAWRADWSSLSLLLRACVGDPLGALPADDPGALRVLERQGEDWRWRIRFTGGNRCRLDGELMLNARQDRVDARQLDAEGQPWLEGGIDRARDLLRAQYGLPGVSAE